MGVRRQRLGQLTGHEGGDDVPPLDVGVEHAISIAVTGMASSAPPAEQGGTEHHGGEGDPGVQVHSAGADARLQREVLDLLVEDCPPERDDPDPWLRARQPHQDRQGDGDVGADRGDELRDEPVQIPRASQDGMPMMRNTSAEVAPLIAASTTRAAT